MSKPRHEKLKVLHGPLGSWIDSHGKEKQKVWSTHLQAQPHVMRLRPYVRAMLMPRLVKDGKLDTFVEGGELRVRLDPPARAADFWDLLERADAKTISKKQPPDEIIVGSYKLLSDTGKMGCYSWSLPAGPRGQQGHFVTRTKPTKRNPNGTVLDIGSGTCPGSNSGFSLMPQYRLDAQGQPILDKNGNKVLVVTDPDPKTFICNSCLTGDSRVLVRHRGLVPMEDLAGTSFEVWSGKAWRQASCVATGVREVVELRTTWGHRVRLTADHRVLTREDEWVEAGDLEPDDQLAFEPPTDVTEVDEAPIRFPAPTADAHHNALTESFPKQWSHDVGVVLGHILGNGTVSLGRYPCVQVAMGEQDRYVIDNLQRIVSTWTGTSAETKIHQPKASAFCEAPKPQAHIAWRARRFVEFLQHLGLDKSVAPEARRAPSGVWQAGTSAARGFLAGMFGSDGSVALGDKIEVCLASVSHGLLEDVQQLLFAYFGIKSTICAYAKSNAQRLEAGWRPLYKLSISSRPHVLLFSGRVGFDNPRRQAKLLEYIAEEEARPRSRARGHRDTYPAVAAVDPQAQPEMVYDLSVEEDHQFVANNITAHNCYAIKGTYGNVSTVTGQEARMIMTEILMQDLSTQKGHPTS